MQRLGDNVLNTVKEMASSDCLQMPCPEQEAKILFFDVLGLFVVQYPRSIATPLNYAVCFLVVLKILFNIIYGTKGRVRECKLFSQCNTFFIVSGKMTMSNVYNCKAFCRQICLAVLSLISAASASLMIVLVVLVTKITMVWYSNWLLLVPLYVLPSVTIGLYVHSWWSKRAGAVKVNIR